MNTVCVLGLGHVGLPTACMFATHGLSVLGVDIDAAIIGALQEGRIHVAEPGLADLLQSATTSHTLRFATEPEPAAAWVIAVPTPLMADKQADLRHVVAAAEAIVPHLHPGNLVVVESTLPPGATEDVVAPILQRSGLWVGRDVALAYVPERILPGRALHEMTHNPRVIGGVDGASAEAARRLYAAFVQGAMALTDARTAELVKLMENASRDVNIALANEFCRMAEAARVDVWQAIALANMHPRVRILQPGPGVGGECVATDPWFLAQHFPAEATLIRQARRINDSQPEYVAHRIRQLAQGFAQPQIACLGLTYKADVDDTRNSPALAVALSLIASGHAVRAHDPHIRQHPALGQRLWPALEPAIAEADIVAVLVDHQAYRRFNPAPLPASGRRALVFDARNGLEASRWQRAGYDVVRLGDTSAPPAP